MPKAEPKPSSQPVTRKAAGSAPTKARAAKNKGTASPAAPPPPKAGKGSKATPGARAAKEAPRRPAKVELVVDRALKERWEKVEASVRASKQKGAAAFDELWEAVGEVLEHDPPLYLAGGFATAKAFLALAKGPLRAVTVRLARGKLSFGGVDPGALPALAQALASLKLPES